MRIKIQPYHTSLNTKKFALKTLLSATLLCDAILPYRTDRTEDRTQASRDESIECKNEIDSFPQLIDLIFTEQMYLYWNIHIVQNSWQVCVLIVKVRYVRTENGSISFCIQLTQPARQVPSRPVEQNITIHELYSKAYIFS